MMTGFKEPIVDGALNYGSLGSVLKPFQISDLLVWIDRATKTAAREHMLD